MTTTPQPFVERLARVERRLAEHAARPVPSALTEPDPGGTERWEAGQVWAHVAEFPGYWVDQIRHILSEVKAGEDEPIPFGRTHTDPGRIAAIEEERRTDPAELLRRATTKLAEASELLGSLPEDAWWDPLESTCRHASLSIL